MPIRSRHGPAGRQEETTSKKGRHPLIADTKSRHFAVWNYIRTEGNPSGGITAAQLKDGCWAYHPQIVADLQKHALVAKTGERRAKHHVYVADEKGKGVNIQSVAVTVEVFETDKGAFVTRTTLHGRIEDPGKIVRLLATKNITIDIPPGLGSGIRVVPAMAEYMQPDEEPDVYELHKARKAKAPKVIEVAAEQVTPEIRAALYQTAPYDPGEDDGCIIDQ